VKVIFGATERRIALNPIRAARRITAWKKTDR